MNNLMPVQISPLIDILSNMVLNILISFLYMLDTSTHNFSERKEMHSYTIQMSEVTQDCVSLLQPPCPCSAQIVPRVRHEYRTMSLKSLN